MHKPRVITRLHTTHQQKEAIHRSISMIVAVMGEWEGRDSMAITEVTLSDYSPRSNLHCSSAYDISV